METSIGYCYHSSFGFEKGVETWNSPSDLFFVGCCEYWGNGKIKYLQGSVYSIRLYCRSITQEDIKNNYEKTLKYRESF